MTNLSFLGKRFKTRYIKGGKAEKRLRKEKHICKQAIVPT